MDTLWRRRRTAGRVPARANDKLMPIANDFSFPSNQPVDMKYATMTPREGWKQLTRYQCLLCNSNTLATYHNII
jgi:hypothetical protein